MMNKLVGGGRGTGKEVGTALGLGIMRPELGHRL